MTKLFNFKILFALGAIVATLAVGLQLTTAEPPTAEKSLLTQSEFPTGTTIQIRSALIPGSWENGMVDQNGVDLVHEFISGERVDFMVPLTKIEGTPKEESQTSAYVANLVYRFTNAEAARREFEHLVAEADVQPHVKLIARKGGNASSVILQAQDDEIPGAAHQWFLRQRGKYLIVLLSPAPLAPTFQGESHAVGVDAKSIARYNEALESKIFSKINLLESR